MLKVLSSVPATRLGVDPLDNQALRCLSFLWVGDQTQASCLLGSVYCWDTPLSGPFSFHHRRKSWPAEMAQQLRVLFHRTQVWCPAHMSSILQPSVAPVPEDPAPFWFSWARVHTHTHYFFFTEASGDNFKCHLLVHGYSYNRHG